MQNGKSIVKLLPNRVRRNYTGGKGIDKLKNKKVRMDGDTPEEWIGSLVEARNPGLPKIENEGLSVADVGEKFFLKGILEENWDFYVGETKEKSLGYLVKILDSNMRLHLQAHPSTEFAREYMGKPWGKLECYYVIDIRPDIDPYIYLGFQKSPDEEKWKEIIENQKITEMFSCFEKIKINKGDVWYIPGGMPHAIGEGITMIEIMEPSDLVVRCEFERKGIVVPEEARFMGKDLEFCMKIFDYNEYSKEFILKKCKIKPKEIVNNTNYKIDQLIDPNYTKCFEVFRLTAKNKSFIKNDGKFYTCVVTKGNLKIKVGYENILFNQGDSYIVAAKGDDYEILPQTNEVEIIMVSPGSVIYK